MLCSSRSVASLVARGRRSTRQLLAPSAVLQNTTEGIRSSAFTIRCKSTQPNSASSIQEVDVLHSRSSFQGGDKKEDGASSVNWQSSSLYGRLPTPDATIAEAAADHMYGEHPRTSMLMELTDRVGVLHDVLRFFWKHDVNVCRIESRPVKAGHYGGKRFDFYVDLEGTLQDANVQALLASLRPMTRKLLILDEKEVHWFPRHISELDLIAHRVLDAGTDLESDHPGFQDSVYRARRAALTQSALQHTWDAEIPRIEYTPDETAVWTAVWDKMEGLWGDYACKEYLEALELMKQHCGYSRNQIPQQQDISEYLQRKTQFRMRPVAGLLSSRDFLNGLAFRVFFSTQYIRHHSKPLYTPEPDICHELLGHAPMFCNRDFADFSQEIGLASLGASDDDVDKLAHCYWHSVEFGLCTESEGSHKAYGAGLLSSFGELEYACSPEHPGADAAPEIKPWEPEVAARQAFPITTYQPVYFLADSLEDAKNRMRRYCQDLSRPFFALHNAQTNMVHIDRPVQRTRGEIPNNNAATQA